MGCNQRCTQRSLAINLYFRKHYAYAFANIEEFLEKHDLQMLTQEEIKDHSTKGILASDNFIRSFTKTLRNRLYNTHKLRE